MTTNYESIVLTDSLERELLNRELDALYAPSLFSLVRSVIRRVAGARGTLTSYVAAVSSDMDRAREDGHRLTVA